MLSKIQAQYKEQIGETIAFVDNFPSFCDQRPVEGPGLAVNLNVEFNQKNVETKAFPTTWSDQLHSIQTLKLLINKGEEYASIFYSTRTCSQAIPQLPEHANEEIVTDHSKKVVEVLNPVITMIIEFKNFIKQFIVF